MRLETGSFCAWTFVRSALPSVITLAIIAWGAGAHGQAKVDGPVDEKGYRILPPVAKFLTPEGRSLENKVKSEVRGVIDGKNLLSEYQTKFDAYYSRHYFPLMTRTDVKSLEELPEERARFMRDLEAAKDADVHEHIVDLALANLVPIVQNNFHPAVRYNAVLIIGSLNQTEAVRIGSAKATPEPHIRALPILYAEFTKAENTDLLKVGALLGLVRHLEWDPFRTTPIPAVQRTAVIKALQDLATMKEPPEGRSAEGHLWMRRRAIEGLGNSGWSKAEPGVIDALTKLLVDEKESIDLRVATASAIGRSAYVAPTKMDIPLTAKELGQLAVISCMDELDRVADLKKQEEERQLLLKNQSGGGYGGGYGGSGYGGSGMPSMPSMPGYGESGGSGLLTPPDPKGYRLDPLRRKMRARLYGVQTALSGPPDPNDTNTNRGAEKLAKTPAEKKAVEDILKSVEKVITIIETPDQAMAELDKDLRRALKPLDELTRRPKPEVAPAGDDPGDEPGIPVPGPAVPTAGGPGKAGRPAVRPASAPATAAVPAAKAGP